MKLILPTSVETVNAALKKLSEARAKVKLDGNVWSFSVKGVEGRFAYDHEKQQLTIVVDDMPFLASEAMVEREIRKFFN